MTKHASCLKFSKEEFRRIMEQKKMQVLEDDYDWWTERMARHEMYMQLRQTGELNYSQLAYLKGKGLQSIPQFLLYSTQFSVEGIEEKEQISGRFPKIVLGDLHHKNTSDRNSYIEKIL